MLKRVGLNGLWTSPGLDPDAIDHVVCIPTFKRPEQLRRTLSSLATQDTTRRFALVIVDNDTEGLAGFGAAKDFLAGGALGGVVLSEATRGNCAAINRAFGTARDVFPNAVSFLMIDDDEWAEPHWLEAMVRTAETTGTDIVGGPVLFESRIRSRPTAVIHFMRRPIRGPARCR